MLKHQFISSLISLQLSQGEEAVPASPNQFSLPRTPANFLSRAGRGRRQTVGRGQHRHASVGIYFFCPLLPHPSPLAPTLACLSFSSTLPINLRHSLIQLSQKQLGKISQNKQFCPSQPSPQAWRLCWCWGLILSSRAGDKQRGDT